MNSFLDTSSSGFVLGQFLARHRRHVFVAALVDNLAGVVDALADAAILASDLEYVDQT